MTRELAEGEVLRVTSGSLVAFETSVQYEVGMMPGIKNVMFGGEGLFVTTLTGPGNVWLQGMPADRMIAEISRRVPGPGIGLGVPIGFGGGGGGDAGTATDTPGGVDAGTAGVGDEAAAAAAATSGAGGAEEAVAATDAAVEADRQATVAASGMDADSQSALFGDAVSESDTVISTTTSGDGTGAPPDLESASSVDSSDSFGSQESTFGDDANFSDQATFSDEPTFKDDVDGGFGDQQQGGGLFDDSKIEGLGGGDGAGDDGEGGQSVLKFIWDLFTGGGDD